MWGQRPTAQIEGSDEPTADHGAPGEAVGTDLHEEDRPDDSGGTLAWLGLKRRAPELGDADQDAGAERATKNGAVREPDTPKRSSAFPRRRRRRPSERPLLPASGPAMWGLKRATRRAGVTREAVREKTMGNRVRYAIGVFREAMRRFVDDDHAVYAGHMAFTMLLSLGPFIVCSIILAQQFDPLAATHLIEMIEQLRASALIPGPMANLLIALVENVAPDPDVAVTTVENQGWWVIWVSAAVGLYAGSSAFEAARNGFNEAYDTRDKRFFLFRRFQSHLLALSIASLFVMASVGFVTVTISFNAFAEAQAFFANFGMPGDWWRLGILAMMVLGVAFMFWMLLLGIHLTLPRGYVKRWHLYIWAQDEIDDIRAVKVPVKPGVRTSAFLWLAFAVTYSYVIGTYVKFDTNHGALAGVVATLLFFYISASMIFFGAQINIAIATLDKRGQPVWPHPYVPRPADFDESTQEAFRVLTEPHSRAVPRRLWHYLCGGTAKKRPEDKVTVEQRADEDANESRDMMAGAAGAAAAAASIAMGGS